MVAQEMTGQEMAVQDMGEKCRDRSRELGEIKQRIEIMTAVGENATLVVYKADEDVMEAYLPGNDGRTVQIIKDFSTESRGEDIVFPADRRKVRGVFFACKEGRRTIDFRTTIPPSKKNRGEEGGSGAGEKVRWCRMYCQKACDEQGDIKRIIAVIVDVTREVELTEEIRKDPLTGAYKAEAMPLMVGDYIGYLGIQSRGFKGAALLICCGGTECGEDEEGREERGDEIKDLAALLLKSFRSEDMVFRTAETQFLIIMKNVPSESVVKRRAEDLKENFPSSLIIGTVMFDESVGSAEKLLEMVEEKIEKIEEGEE